MIVHICCSVDSHYFLQQLKKSYQNEKLIGFFYNPNIHPYSEYMLRLQDVRYSCDMLSIELIVGEYDINSWLEATKDYKNEPEKGKRCDLCFENRLSNTIKIAKQYGEKSFTTTLLMSAKKSQEKLKTIGDKLQQKHNIEFVFEDYRVSNGIANQSLETKKAKLYRQNYCGCLYALSAQRHSQDKFASELISNIGRQVLPNSIEEKLSLYATKNKKNINIIKINFLNYRLFSAYVKVSQITVPSYFLIYSHIVEKSTDTKIEFEKDGLVYTKNSVAVVLNIDKLNHELNTNYKNTKELIYSPPTYHQEQNLRQEITNTPYNNIAIIVLDTIPKQKFFIYCDSLIYDDTKEIFI